MQVCMLTPSNAAVIDQETCPVRIDITDRGFPKGIPALRWHERALAQNPWIRRRFGHFVLIDPWGQELLDVAYGTDGLDQLQAQIAQFRERISDRDAARHPQPQHATRTSAEELPERFHQGPLSLPFMTAYELSFDHWLEVIDLLADGARLAPGVRNAALHALGEFVLSEAPYDRKTCREVSMAVSRGAGRPAEENIATPCPEQWDLRERAAFALVRIARLPIEAQDHDFVDPVRSWWSQHRNDEAFRIEWSDDPDLEYAFLR